MALKRERGARWDIADHTVRLTGDWTLPQLAGQLQPIEAALRSAPAHADWNLQDIERLDSVGALLLWRVWGEHYPPDLQISAQHRQLFQRLDGVAAVPRPKRSWGPYAALSQLGAVVVGQLQDLWGLLLLWGAILSEGALALRHPRHFPWREISATIFKTGPQSLPILTLIGFLIGIVITYQSAPTLATYGANIYVISIAGISILREFGPLITAVILAGRSGSAFTAQIGAMRVTQELDALQTFGISPVQRLVLPKVIAMAVTVPLLVIWTDAVGLFGGMLVAHFSLHISPRFFLQEMPSMVPAFNFWLGIAKGALFGILIAWIAGYHGLKIRANTDSLSHETTNSVVLAITLVIVIDAILAVVFANTGINA